jgi:nitrogen fixation protein FixH
MPYAYGKKGKHISYADAYSKAIDKLDPLKREDKISKSAINRVKNKLVKQHENHSALLDTLENTYAAFGGSFMTPMAPVSPANSMYNEENMDPNSGLMQNKSKFKDLNFSLNLDFNRSKYKSKPLPNQNNFNNQQQQMNYAGGGPFGQGLNLPNLGSGASTPDDNPINFNFDQFGQITNSLLELLPENDPGAPSFYNAPYVSDKGFKAINKFENTIGYMNPKTGKPASMNAGNNYTQTADKAIIEDAINSTIGKETWDLLPEDVKTQAYSFMFNNGVFEDDGVTPRYNWLNGLAQAIDNANGGGATGKERRAYTKDQAINTIKGTDSWINNGDLYDNYLNVLGDQYNSIANNTTKYNSGIGLNYTPTLRNRALSINNILNPVQQTSNTQSNTQANNTNLVTPNQSLKDIVKFKEPEIGPDNQNDLNELAKPNPKKVAKGQEEDNSDDLVKLAKKMAKKQAKANALKAGIGAGAQSLGALSALGYGLRGGDDVSFGRKSETRVNPKAAMNAGINALNKITAGSKAAVRGNAKTYADLLAGNVVADNALMDSIGQTVINPTLAMQQFNAQLDKSRKVNNTNITMQEAIARQQEQDAARSAVTTGLGKVGSAAATGISNFNKYSAQSNYNNQMMSLLPDLFKNYDISQDENGNWKINPKSKARDGKIYIKKK